MTYAYDNYIQLPTVDLYDTNMMAMAINAAKDMYDRGQQQIKDFYKEYGDFMSPFAKDMEVYGNMVGGVRNLINTAYANGIDLLRSPEGRALINKAVYSVDPAKFNLMRSNAKTGYAYLDAMQKLRSQGKYSEAQELYDIMQNGGTKFSDFSTFDENGTHVWDRTSPIEATSLLDLTYDSYKNRTPRDLTAADFIESNGLTPSMFDKRYQYTGYLNSDLMKVAPGAAMSIAADPRAAYFRDLAEQKVAARGGNYTQADVDAQFYRDIADANRWALVDPTKKVDEYAMQAQKAADAIRLEGIRAANDREIAQIKAKDSGDNNELPGNYFHNIALKAGQVNNAFKSVLAESRMNGLQKSIENAAKIKDPKKRDEAIKEIQTRVKNIPTRAMKDFLLRPQYGSNGKNIANIILDLTPSSRADGVTAINTILGNMAAPGDNAFNANYVLSKSGFAVDPEDKSLNPWLISDGTEKTVVTPQQLLHNIIKYESGDFQIRNVKDESHPIKKEDILAKLKDSEGNWMYDTGFKRMPGKIAQQAQRIKSDAEHGGMIVAPDENGVKHLWIKVIVGSNGFLQGDHNGYWVKSPMTYGQNNTTLSDIGVSEYASGVRESHDNTKTAVEWQQGGINW